MLSVDTLSKTYPGEAGPTAVLKGVSFGLDDGDTMALQGESGSGKSTLLHLIGGLDRADSGRIVIGEDEVTALDDRGRARLRRDSVGIVFQQFNLIPSLTVADNLAFQARLAGRRDTDWDARLTDRLGLADHGKKYPEQLSGGQQQRVAIGRALAAKPRLVLADEPTGNLDEDTGERVLDLMLDLVRETGATLLMVTHSAQLAARMKRRLYLERGALSG